MLKGVIRVGGIALPLLFLSGCSLLNKVSPGHFNGPKGYPHRVYAKNRETGKVYYAGSRRSLARARALALRKCQRQTQDLNVCQLIDTEES